MNPPPEQGRFEPVHDAHAIEQVVIAVHFVGGLDDSRLRILIDSLDTSFAAELPGRIELQGFSFAFGAAGFPPPGAVVAPPGPAGLTGKQYSRLRPDGAAESELRIERGSIVFRSTVYTRWEEVWGRARRYVAAALPTYAAAVPINAIGLNFQDKFYWVGDLTDFSPKFLLRPNSKYVCHHLYDATDLWHSHTGAFLRADDNTKRLINLNLDCLDETTLRGTRRVVSIATGLSDMFNQPGYSPTTLGPAEAMALFEQRLPQLHAVSKNAFKDLITDTMCRRIALD